MGKAIILSDQDFSQKNLGRVTFSLTNEEKAASVANAYCEEIGDNTKYESVYSFVLGLLNSGHWDKMKAVYPMYGDTLAKLCTNLPSPGTFDLKVGGNATAEDGNIDFVRTIGTGDVGTPVSPISGRYVFVALCFVCHQLGSSGTVNGWYDARNANGDSDFHCNIYCSGAGIYLNLKNNTPSTLFQWVNPAEYNHNLVSFAIDRNTGDYVVMLNGEVTSSGTIANAELYTSIVFNNILGHTYWTAKDTPAGEVIEKNTKLADGKAFFFALGEVEPSNAGAVSQAIIDGIIADKGITLGE